MWKIQYSEETLVKGQLNRLKPQIHKSPGNHEKAHKTQALFCILKKNSCGKLFIFTI